MLHTQRAILPAVIFATIVTFGNAPHVGATDCSCGYYDASAETLWTESIIVYFNETTALPVPNFDRESYSHKYEKGWNTQFRIGADVSNICLSNSTSPAEEAASLELQVSPYKSDHLVVGSSIRSSRQDIQYGSFTSLLRSPGKAAGGGGSVLSFALDYNSTQSISANLKNTNTPSTASVSMLAGEEDLSANFLYYDNITDGTFGNDTLSPWEDTEYRLEWTKDEVRYFIGSDLARSISRSEDKKLLSVPSSLYFRHWSNGLASGSQGPPDEPSVANVGWARLFFNSSLMSDKDHAAFDEGCSRFTACDISDTSLRGTTNYNNNSTIKWKQAHGKTARRVAAIWLAVACISVTTLVLLGPIWTRVKEKLGTSQEVAWTPEERRESALLNDPGAEAAEELAQASTLNSQTTTSLAGTVTLCGTKSPSITPGPCDPSIPPSASPEVGGADTLRRSSADLPSCQKGSDTLEHSSSETKRFDEQISNEKLLTDRPNQEALHDTKIEARKEEEKESCPAPDTPKTNKRRMSWTNVGWGKGASSVRPLSTADPGIAPEIPTPIKLEKKSDAAPKLEKDATKILEPQKRIEHLMGIVVLSCLLETAINFNLTYAHGALLPDKFVRYHSETVARRTISAFFLNRIWIGPFLLTSARFLTSNYLRTGDLLAVSEKALSRTFRLMLPVIGMVSMEYFFVACSATKWLEYLPSITWSTWPFIRGYSNFGNFLSEVLELVYVIPNTLPVITFNYCTNVLWTIPVQLQGSWTALLAVIVIREIKSPWKRFAFYSFCIINHWYALSWGSYFYFGILLTDLDVTYKWQPYLRARPLMYYQLLLLCVFSALAGPTMDLLSQRAGIDYAAYEYGIHSNLRSGLTILEASGPPSLQFFIPRLNGLVFAVGLQAAVEISPLIQRVLSFKLFLSIFPHIFTIYLIHGFIFWSLGSWLCVFLAVRGLSYWSNVLIVAFCCYVTLGLSVIVLTPVVNCLGKTVTRDIWHEASYEPPPRHPTLYPFPKDKFLNRYEITTERKPSKDVSMDTEEFMRTGSVRMITRERKPSKDVRTSWQERKPSAAPGTAWHERQRSIYTGAPGRERQDSAYPRRTSWNDRRPSTDPSSPWFDRRSSIDPWKTRRESKYAKPPMLEMVEDEEAESSTNPRTPQHERQSSIIDPGTPGRERQDSTYPRNLGPDRRSSTDPTSPWAAERRASAGPSSPWSERRSSVDTRKARRESKYVKPTTLERVEDEEAEE